MNQDAIIDPIAANDANLKWRWFERAWAIAILCLIAATWKLWSPSSGFPAVAMFAIPFPMVALDVVAIGILIASLAWVALTRQKKRYAFLFVLVGFGLAFIQNQHRLQPWAYQAALQSIVFAALLPRPALRWLMAISISIYFFSACGKFDYQFLHTVGQDFVSVVLGPIEGEPSRLRIALAASLPATELAIAIGLCFARSRRFAGVAAMMMHASLVGLLGPWNLAHSPGVLLWNVCLLLQAWFLYIRKPSEAAITLPATRLATIAKAIITLALIMPLFERSGYWDHWLSWSLYSPHTSRVEIEVHESVLASLPKSAHAFVLENEHGDAWHLLETDRWSLESVGVPIYPQARFQVGVARNVAKSISDADGIRIKVKSVADRWTGARVEAWWRGRSEIETAAQDYLFLEPSL